MVGIIICGHGSFASGIASTVALVAGEQEDFVSVDFNGSDDLASALSQAVNKLGTEQYIIFTDILGGAPFREASLLAEKNSNMQVVAGVTPQMLIEACLERDDYENLESDVIALLDSAKDGITSLAQQKANRATSNQSSADGI